MKKLLIILTIIFVCGAMQAQIKPVPNVNETTITSLREDFQKSLREKNYNAAMDKAVEISEALLQQKRYKEAASLYYQMDQATSESERSSGKTNFRFRFLTANQRLRMYTRENKPESSKTQLNAMHYCMGYIDDEALKDEMLLTEAEYYNNFGMARQSLDRYMELLQRCVAGSEEDSRENCYKDMLAYSERNKMTTLTKTVQERYTAWQDSIRMVKAAQELEVLRQEHQTLQQNLEEKEATISRHSMVTIGLTTVIVLLIVAVLAFIFMLLRNVYQVRKYKNSLKIANESNEQKSHFISNINTQITPSLDAMETAMTGSPTAAIALLQENIVSLRKRIDDMQTYISLEETREESYPVTSVDIHLLCENIMTRERVHFQKGIDAVVAVPKVSVKTNTEALDQVLTYLLSRAARYTEAGKISLEFKKRNARTGQFIITDTGTPIPAEKQQDLFKPFGETDPDSQDDWLLPICQLMAYKLNGTLKIDTEYTKGTRFILDLCS